MALGKNLSRRLRVFPHLVHDLTYYILANPILLGNICMGDFLHQDRMGYIQPLPHSQWLTLSPLSSSSNSCGLHKVLVGKLVLVLPCSVVPLFDFPGDLGDVSLSLRSLSLSLIYRFHDLGPKLLTQASDQLSMLKKLLRTHGKIAEK